MMTFPGQIEQLTVDFNNAIFERDHLEDLIVEAIETASLLGYDVAMKNLSDAYDKWSL